MAGKRLEFLTYCDISLSVRTWTSRISQLGICVRPFGIPNNWVSTEPPLGCVAKCGISSEPVASWSNNANIHDQMSISPTQRYIPIFDSPLHTVTLRLSKNQTRITLQRPCQHL